MEDALAPLVEVQVVQVLEAVVLQVRGLEVVAHVLHLDEQVKQVKLLVALEPPGVNSNDVGVGEF